MYHTRSIRTVYRLTIIISLLFATSLFAEELPDIFARVNPAVVDIQAISVETVAIPGQALNTIAVGNDGSGVLIDDEGTILTASHVIQTAEKVTVTFFGGEQVPATVVASANWGDIALIKLDQKIDLPPPAILADSDLVRIGDKVFVIGAPFGFSHSLSVGHISSRFKTEAMIGTGTIEVFQTDAAMNPGNSGGPLFNMDGEIIGIASHIRTTAGGFNGIAFAVTSNQVVRMLEKTSTWTGIEGIVVSGQLARLLNLPQEAGLLVQRVAANSWSGAIGLQPSSIKAVIGGEEITLGGDIILKVGDLEVNMDPDLFQKITDYFFNEKQVGRTASLQVLRAGRVITLSVEKD